MCLNVDTNQVCRSFALLSTFEVDFEVLTLLVPGGGGGGGADSATMVSLS